MLIVFGRAVLFPFVAYDDDTYVWRNDTVLRGLSAAGLWWALTTFTFSNWHPLVWLSYMLDASVFQSWAGGYHLTNLVLHAVNAVLLFRLLLRITDGLWRSALVAALFALHPLRVESVVWVSERKGLLSTMFWLLALGAYVSFTQRRTAGRYLAVAGWFALGLMSKPMIVTLPLTLLLVDYWPLGRLKTPRDAVRLCVEKLPLLALSAASSAVTVIAQHQGGAVRSLTQAPAAMRPANAVVSLVRYLEKTFWPHDMAVLYLFPTHLNPWLVAGSAALVLAITVAVFVVPRPWLRFGWLWFLITLLPVLGLVQVGFQAMADRYAYVPQIGVWVAVVWELAAWLGRPAWRRLVAGCSAVAALLLCAVITVRQLNYWRDTVALFEHTLAVTGPNYVIHNALALVLAYQQQYPEAVRQFEAAIAAKPDFPEPYAGLGVLRLAQGDNAGGLAFLRQSLAIKPDDPRTHYHAGLALMRMCDADAALPHLLAGLPDTQHHADVEYLLGQALTSLGRPGEAVQHYRTAADLQPGAAGPLVELAWIFATSPDDALRKPAEAVDLAGRADTLANHGDPAVLDTLAAAYAADGKFDQAVDTASKALELIKPDQPVVKAGEVEEHLRLFRLHIPLRQPPRPRLPMCHGG